MLIIRYKTDMFVTKYSINENGGVLMELSTGEIIKKKILDAQEMVRDYETYSKKIQDTEITDLFHEFAEECGVQATELKKLLDEKYK